MTADANGKPEYAALGQWTAYRVEGLSKEGTWDNLAAALGNLDLPPKIDPVGLIEIINRGYCFGTRTLVQGIRRAPAAARQSDGRFEWIPLAEHDETKSGPAEIARDLFERLSAELEGVCRDRGRIGLLLSGGMDSRIVACVLKKLQRAGRLSGSVIALTWGIDGCRDVVYATRVAELFGWEHRYFRLTPEQLAKNIAVAGFRGAEYSPVHLHAMAEIAEQVDLDLVIAASFGDSVGRAEFSGSHIRDLKAIDRHIYNRFKLLHGGVFKECVSDVYRDAGLYRPLMGNRTVKQHHEVDHQLHYMQRMLVPCMEVIHQSVPVYQTFTSPDVYGYMWSLAPECRGNRIYHEILSHQEPALLDIPWARTGRAYLGSDSVGPDALSRNNNLYGRWLRMELRDYVKDLVLSEEISQLRVFNMRSLETLLRRSELGTNDKATQLQEILVWVASLARFVERYGIGTTVEPKIGLVRDHVNGRILSLIHAIAYEKKIAVQGYAKRWRK